MKRNNLQVMRQLLSMAVSLKGTMFLAVTLGVIGNLCAIFIPVFGAYGLAVGNLKVVFTALPILAVCRGVFHYLEQNRNHYLAFKILALVRDRVFGALRKLAPAKLEGKEKGNLIAVLTSDIELLEVFYAHTISPVCIAAIMTVIMTAGICAIHPLLGMIAFVSYCVMGIVVPLAASKRSRAFGEEFRQSFGELDAFVLDNLRGINESIQFQAGGRQLNEMGARSDALAEKEKQLKGAAGTNTAVIGGAVLVLDAIMLFAAISLCQRGMVSFERAVLAVVSLMSSFGPTIALANLGTGLQSTFAAGNRVLDILEEEPNICEVTGGMDIRFSSAECRNVHFSYETDEILHDFSLEIGAGKVVGITGKSGSGKSTLLKLLMRFWDAEKGLITLSDEDIKGINTDSLRENESYVTQETQLFHDSIERNLLIANPNASHEQIVEACKKASVHDFIMTLPKGYDNEVGELGETLSGGERQRLGIARAFLHDAPLVLLDEPTSNLDSLNEAVILKSIRDYRGNKTFVLVSHRKSTMQIADQVFSVENGRVS